MQQQGAGTGAPAPNAGQGQQQAQAAVAAAASAQQMAAAASAQQAAALAAMLPAAAASGVARPTLALHPALAAINPGLAAAGMLPVAGPGGTFTFAARSGMQQPFFYPAVPQPVPTSAPTPASAAAAAGAAGRRPSSRPSRSSSSAAAGKKHCNCKNSRCLKLYCECFASGRYCDGCNCINCHNNREHEATRQAAVEAILERNPNAFRPKIAGGTDSRRSGGARHNKGCNCKKSGCLKKYCECFQAGIVCSEICKCLDCKNFEGSDARDALISPQSDRHGSPMGLRRTSRTISPGAPGPVAPAPRPGFSPNGAAPAALPGLAQLQQAQAAAAVQAAAAAQAAAAPKALGADQRMAVAREAVREVVKPEVVEKVAMLLMVVSQEEFDRRQAAAVGSQQQAGSDGAAAAGAASEEAAAMDLDLEQQPEQQQEQTPGPVGGGAASPQGAAAAVELKAEGMEVDATEPQGQAAVAAANRAAEPSAAAVPAAPPSSEAEGCGGEEGLYEAQERLVLQEFRDTLQMISRVVGEKVEKKAAAAQQQQQQQQQQMLLLHAQTPGSGGGLGLAALPQLRPAGQPGHPGVLMAAATPGQQPQLVLLPQALMAQQLAAASQQLGRAVTLQQTTQGLQAVLKPGEALPAAPAAPVVPALVQQQQQQQQPAAQAATAATSDGK